MVILTGQYLTRTKSRTPKASGSRFKYLAGKASRDTSMWTITFSGMNVRPLREKIDKLHGKLSKKSALKHTDFGGVNFWSLDEDTSVEWICWLNGQRIIATTPEEMSILEARRQRVKENVDLLLKEEEERKAREGSGRKITTMGKDVNMKILSFAQQGTKAICVLAASGVISNVTLGQANASGGTLTYEGRFDILKWSGGMSVSLVGSDGRVLGGGLARMLVAAGPVQGAVMEPSRTGTGKTFAFGIPIMDKIIKYNNKNGRGRNPFAVEEMKVAWESYHDVKLDD
ncbi:hypothetical protein L1887_01725 [Cichorium endivia]|nr:hypothetical protein L1887_01725 [Cichorium endivia]